MEKGLIFDIRRYSVHDGPGIRTTVFFKGCPLKCSWCHNPESWLDEPQVMERDRVFNGHSKRVKETVGRWYSAEEIIDIVMKDRVFYEESGGGLTVSGGEPLQQGMFLKELLSLCQQYGIHTAIDTSGYVPEDQFSEITGLAKLVLYDIKSANNTKHQEYTGVSNDLIIKNLYSLKENGPKLIIRIPVIPGFNDQLAEMRAILDVIRPVKERIQRVDLLPYHRLGINKYESLGIKPFRLVDQNIRRDDITSFMKLYADNGFPVKKGG